MSNLGALNHNALKFLVEADAVASVTAVAQADKWSLQILCGSQNKTVVSKNSKKTRVWRRLDTLTKYLLDLGIKKFEIDASHYDPENQTLKRPDSAAALKRTHSAHKKLLEQNNSITFTNETAVVQSEKLSPSEVRDKWEKRRAKILEEDNPSAK